MLYHNTDLKRFLKNLTLVVIALVVLDFLIGGLIKHYYFKQKSGPLYRTTYAIDSTRANLLVFGSSRANHHYVPAIFKNKLHTTFYNCGRDNCDLIYDAALISAVLERYTPKHIILELNPDELSRNEEGKLSVLLPYKNNPAIYPYLQYDGKFENIKLLSKIYPYNSTILNIVSALHNYSTGDDSGYIKLDNVMAYHEPLLYKQTIANSARIKILDDILKKLNARHVAVTLVTSPIYQLFIEPDMQVLTLKKIYSKYNNVKYFNYENNPAFKDNRLYSDEHHLNGAGANKFSEDLADKLSAVN